MTRHILIVADGRSPTALRWIENTLALGYQVSLISTFPCQQPPGLTHFNVLPVAFSRFSGQSQPSGSTSTRKGLKCVLRRFLPILQKLRYLLGPLTLPFRAKTFKDLIRTIQPDLVHALRIPFEGMLAAYTPIQIPLIAATWGNDLTLHAKGSPLMRRFTRRCLNRADGLTSDTCRDVRLAHAWGLDSDAPTLVVPGSGGLDLTAIENTPDFDASQFDLPETHAWVVNPRGLRPGSVHQDVFFKAIPMVLAQYPHCAFICPSLKGKKHAENWVKSNKVQENTFLLPKLTQPQLWGLLKKAQVFVSPSSHDGTPNTLLEAMACGCFPVAGQIESLEEWIEDGLNGLLVDPRDPNELANAILKALKDHELRNSAAVYNRSLIIERAASESTQPKIDSFYQQFFE